MTLDMAIASHLELRTFSKEHESSLVNESRQHIARPSRSLVIHTINA